MADDALTYEALDAVSNLVNAAAAEVAGQPLPPAIWMWDGAARFCDPAAKEPEFRGSIHPDLTGIDAEAALLEWARALRMVESTHSLQVEAGRRAFSGSLNRSYIRLTADIGGTGNALESDVRQVNHRRHNEPSSEAAIVS